MNEDNNSMNRNATDKCIMIVCHRMETQTALFELLRNTNYEIHEITSLNDLLIHDKDSNFILLQTSEPSRDDSFRSSLINIPHTDSEDNLAIIKILKNSLLNVGGDNTELLSKKYNYLTLGEMEKIHIINTLNRCEWRCRTAAKQLGIDRTTLYRKMKKYGIRRKK
jgi:transcriptional regulator of acetoin/glycerol metabolism